MFWRNSTVVNFRVSESTYWKSIGREDLVATMRKGNISRTIGSTRNTTKYGYDLDAIYYDS